MGIAKSRFIFKGFAVMIIQTELTRTHFVPVGKNTCAFRVIFIDDGLVAPATLKMFIAADVAITVLSHLTRAKVSSRTPEIFLGRLVLEVADFSSSGLGAVSTRESVCHYRFPYMASFFCIWVGRRGRWHCCAKFRPLQFFDLFFTVYFLFQSFFSWCSSS